VYGASGPQNFCDLQADWGPSNYDLRNLFVFSGMYALPVGRGKAILSSPNGFLQAPTGNWNVGTIVSLHSGEALERGAGGDIANVGGGTQRCNQIGNAYGGTGFQQTKTSWLNPATFNTYSLHLRNRGQK
jgi:hypothetical protein